MTALYGGSFDPVHRGHMNIIHAVGRYAEKIIMVPNSRTCIKEPVASFEHRMEMLKLMLLDYRRTFPDDTVDIVISDCEGRRGGISYTADTLKELLPIYGDVEGRMALVVGEDSLLGMERWRDIDFIRKHSEILVVRRYGLDTDFKDVVYLPFDDDSSSSGIRGSEHLECTSGLVAGYIRENRLYM